MPEPNRWITSSKCANCSCVEVSSDPTTATVKVRDSKDRSGPVLTFTPAAWSAFIADIRQGRLDP